MKLLNVGIALVCAAYAAFSDSVLALLWAIWFLIVYLSIDIEQRFDRLEKK